MEVVTLEHKDTEQTVAPEEVVSINFIEAEINKDNEEGVYGGRVHTRFPPEPNGYLHIGHAKSICLNFGLGEEYKGLTNLRFDDTNPEKEDVEYVNSIKEDVEWLGFNWDGDVRYASDYFGKMYDYAKKLITLGKAYVDDQTAEEIRQTRGDFSTPGTNSPYRDRSVEENLKLFEEMKEGKYKDGEKVLRAKIDMADPNIVMRDPVLYRIVNAAHHRTGSEWSIYPMYDFAHPIEDAIERITHSVCTLEFEVHRPLYNWVLEDWEDTEKPRQIEFARLNVTKMVMSKRKLRALVEAGLVSGWDDPRMPTISGLRRRGYTPEAIRDFCDRIGVAKADSTVDIALLEFCIREDLKLKAPRVDTYQYEVQASYQTNNKAFFEGMLQDAQKVGQTDFTKALLYKFIYRLAAVGFRGDGYVNLEGMDYYDKNNHYLAIKVDDKGNATIDDKNLVNLLQIDLKPANEANKAKFE